MPISDGQSACSESVQTDEAARAEFSYLAVSIGFVELPIQGMVPPPRALNESAAN